MIQWLQGRKTYIIAALTIIYAVVVDGLINNDLGTAADKIMIGLGLGTLRAGVTKSGG